MEKEKVLEIKAVKINDEWSAACITCQNEKILKRGEFEDKELGVCSMKEFFFNLKGHLYLRGTFKELDNKVIIISNEEVSRLFDLVDKINEKYGIIKRWRAKVHEKYYYIFNLFEVQNALDIGGNFDVRRYEAGNYFKTEEEAQLYAYKIKKLLSERE